MTPNPPPGWRGSIPPPGQASMAEGRMSGPAPGEESCRCGPTATWGLANAADPRYLGGHVDKQGYRHDPLRHADNCPRLTRAAR